MLIDVPIDVLPGTKTFYHLLSTRLTHTLSRRLSPFHGLYHVFSSTLLCNQVIQWKCKTNQWTKWTTMILAGSLFDIWVRNRVIFNRCVYVRHGFTTSPRMDSSAFYQCWHKSRWPAALRPPKGAEGWGVGMGGWRLNRLRTQLILSAADCFTAVLIQRREFAFGPGRLTTA